MSFVRLLQEKQYHIISTDIVKIKGYKDRPALMSKYNFFI